MRPVDRVASSQICCFVHVLFIHVLRGFHEPIHKKRISASKLGLPDFMEKSMIFFRIKSLFQTMPFVVNRNFTNSVFVHVL